VAEHGTGGSYYDLLEVTANASREEIDASYQRISSYMSPDALAVYSMLDEDESAEMRAKLDEAYRTLCDPDRRAAYDRALSGPSHSYPSVLVPETQSGTNSTVGVVQESRRPSSDLVDVEAIFRVESGGREGATTGTSDPPPRSLAQVLAANELEQDAARQTKRERSAERSADRVEKVDSPSVAAGCDAASPSPSPGPAARPVVTKGAPPAAPVARSTGEPRRDRRVAHEPPRPSRGLGSTRAAPAPAAGRPRRLQPNATIEVGNDTEFSGALLRRLRESCGAELDLVADITKIRKHYLAAIEEHDFASLPAAVYVRGFVVEYARVLGLDVQRVAQSYMSLYNRYRNEGA